MAQSFHFNFQCFSGKFHRADELRFKSLKKLNYEKPLKRTSALLKFFFVSTTTIDDALVQRNISAFV